MPTIPDSNIVLDLTDRAAHWFAWSSRQFLDCSEQGAMVINTIVLAEASARLENFPDVAGLMSRVGLTYEPVSLEASYIAGRAHYLYRKRGGQRERVLPDFLIGAHAAVKGYRILTRDGSRYRTYFPNVEVIAPDTHP